MNIASEKDFEFSAADFSSMSVCDRDYLSLLHPYEEQKIRSAVEKRKTEFLFGRLCAKKSYKKLTGETLGFNELPIFYDENGAPFFENGKVSVSISHDEKVAAAVVCKREKLNLALDVQKITRENTEIIYKFISDDEKRFIDKFKNNADRDFAAGAVFSAKEALSKLFGYGFSILGSLGVSNISFQDCTTVFFENYKNFRVTVIRRENYIFSFAALKKDLEKFDPKLLDFTSVEI